MRFAARQEMEYLSFVRGRSSEDAGLVEELSRRLDALRCYDQHYSNADWRPQAPGARRRSRGRRKPG